MLAQSKIVAFVPTRDATRARAFYAGTLGLTVVSEDDFALVLDANGTMVRVTRVRELTPHPFTVLGWEVSDIDDAVAKLSAQGVSFERYGFPDQDARGVWNAPGGTRIAWLKDPDGNVLSLSQH